MTESEAKARLCPFSFDGPSGTFLCHGSKCMAWVKEFYEPSEGQCSRLKETPRGP